MMIKMMRRLMVAFVVFILVSIIFYFVGIPIISRINEVRNVKIIETFRKNGCTWYSDGCNGCHVDTNGSAGCTLVGCYETRKAECYEYNKPIKPWSIK